MDLATCLPFLASAALGAAAPMLARRLPPVAAVVCLVVGGVVLAASTTLVLGELAFTGLAQLPPVAAVGHWSVGVLSASDPVPRTVMMVSVAAASLLLCAVVRYVARRSRDLWAARMLAITLHGRPGQLHIVDDDEIGVFALPIARGRIVASRAMLAALRPDEGRAVLAHETAHLANHHYLYRLLADLAATMNPLLRPLARAVHFATERWADECAAAEVGDRTVVARALARASLFSAGARTDPWPPTTALAATGTAVVDRVEAMMSPRPRHRPALLIAVAFVLTVALAGAADTQRDTEQVFEQAGIHAAAAHRAQPVAGRSSESKMSATRAAPGALPRSTNHS